MSNEKIPEIGVLYEDEDVLAVNKPAGLMVHSDGRASGPFLTDWIIEKYPEARDVGEPARASDGSDIARPGIVHRLDRETSGVLLVAKTVSGHALLKAQFKDRTIRKRYVAFVWGEMEEEFGTIDRPIGRSGSDFRKWSAQRGARGEMRDAETYWSKLGSASLGEGADIMRFSLIEAEPKTGRTHQIRVHFVAIQHPIVGDTLYAPKRPAALGFTRAALHARSIEFQDARGNAVKVEAPLPADFERAIKQLGIVMPHKRTQS